MTHEDWMQFLGIVVGILVVVVSALIKVLANHSHRQTMVEADVRAMKEVIAEDHRREDVVWLDIRNRLTRIEDKLDRKADKP